jgi:hypothetical protein
MTRKRIHFEFLLFLLLSILPSEFAESKAPSTNNVKSSVKNKEETTEKKDNSTTIIEINDTTTEENDTSSNPSVDRLFRNPILASGLSSGADAINHSIDTLMQSLFYNLVDNKLKWPLTGSSNINLGLTRDVYSARSGAYVVVDRFGIGPDYSKELYRYNNIPVVLGAQQSSDVYDIYLRTDPMRVADNKKLPWWRVAVNNWFGVLPVLEAILPPSFNANEMYDPFNRLETPFTFPLSMASVDLMDVATIKSYSISGGINLGIETSEGLHGFKDQLISGSNPLEMSIPYTVFRTGEYRINVLKKDPHTMWVGVMDTNRLGHRIDTKLGKTFYLLSKTVPLWKGLPAPIFPVDFGLEEAIGDIFGRVYSFDMRLEEAKKAYLEAVHGNFAAAQISWLRFKEDKIETGVKFFYTKKEKRFQTAIASGHNVFVTNKRTVRTHSDAEIEITDENGKYYILEAKEDRDQGRWDILTGKREQNVTLQADLLVRKIVENEPNDPEHKTRYEFVAQENPIDITFSLALNDKFVETEDLANYLDVLSRFTQLKIEGIPHFDFREEEDLAKRRKAVYFENDNTSRHHLHVAPTHLGRFEGYGSIRISNKQLLSIADLPRETLWKGFCAAFGVNDDDTCLLWERSLFWRNIYRTRSLFSQPLRLMDFRWKSADAVSEIENSVSALKKFLHEKSPENKQAALRSLFATDYPLQVVEGVLRLSDLSKIPRSIELDAQPKGNASDEIKDRFRKLDKHRITSETPFPPPARLDSTKAVEAKFDPANLTFFGIKPRIKKITLYKDEEIKNIKPRSKKPEIQDKQDLAPILATKISVTKLTNEDRLHVYAKLEQSGRIQLAKLKLIEDVVEIPIPSDLALNSPDRINFVLKLSGPQSVISSLVSEEALSLGGQFKLTLAVSSNGQIWSDEKTLEFRVEEGNLKPYHQD